MRKTMAEQGEGGKSSFCPKGFAVVVKLGLALHRAQFHFETPSGRKAESRCLG